MVKNPIKKLVDKGENMKLLMMLLGFFPFCLIAHEGCHRAPDSLVAPHGGLIEETNLGHVVEVVNEGKEVKVYVYDHDVKPVELEQYTLKAIMIPQRKQAQELTLKALQDHHVVDTQLAESFPYYTLKLKLFIDKENDEIDFVIEKT
jgi:hypothetical protein